MRSMLAATLIFVAAAASAQAQMTPPSTAGTKPKAVPTVPVRPAPQTPADTANAMAQAERLAIQSDLAWVGQYNGAIIGRSQRAHGGIHQGIPEGPRRQADRRAQPAGAQRARRNRKAAADSAGWKIVSDAGTGVRLGIPDQAGAATDRDANGAKWAFCHRDHPDHAFAAQGGQPDHGETRRSGKEGTRRPQGRLYGASSRTSSCCRVCRA